jgi:Salmonella virulence plasmid 65kDa B protein
MDIKEDTRRYEEWLAKHTALYRPHLKLKHDLMREDPFLSSVQLFTGGYRSGRKFFEVVFDYDDGHYAEDSADADGRVFANPVYSPPDTAKWKARIDPFSSYRAGFEVRTYRLCQRVLMFHHFPDPEELGTPDYLVRSTEFIY